MSKRIVMSLPFALPSVIALTFQGKAMPSYSRLTLSIFIGLYLIIGFSERISKPQSLIRNDHF